MNGYTVKAFDSKTKKFDEITCHSLKAARGLYMKIVSKSLGCEIWKNGTPSKMIASSNPQANRITN